MIVAKCNENGNRQLVLLLRIDLSSAEIGMSNRPSIDTKFQFVFGANDMDCLAIVLASIGVDVRDAVLQLMGNCLSVLTQTYPGCAKYGIPNTIVEAGLPEQILSITEISRQDVPRA